MKNNFSQENVYANPGLFIALISTSAICLLNVRQEFLTINCLYLNIPKKAAMQPLINPKPCGSLSNSRLHFPF